MRTTGGLYISGWLREADRGIDEGRLLEGFGMDWLGRGLTARFRLIPGAEADDYNRVTLPGSVRLHIEGRWPAFGGCILEMALPGTFDRFEDVLNWRGGVLGHAGNLGRYRGAAQRGTCASLYKFCISPTTGSPG